MSSRAARHRPRRVKAAVRKRTVREERKAAERARKEAEWQQAAAEQTRQHDAEERHHERVRWRMVPAIAAVGAAVTFVAVPMAPAPNAAAGASVAGIRYADYQHQPYALYREYTSSPDVGGRPDPHPFEPEPTLYTSLWNSSGGTATINFDILGGGD